MICIINIFVMSQQYKHLKSQSMLEEKFLQKKIILNSTENPDIYLQANYRQNQLNFSWNFRDIKQSFKVSWRHILIFDGFSEIQEIEVIGNYYENMSLGDFLRVGKTNGKPKKSGWIERTGEKLSSAIFKNKSLYQTQCKETKLEYWIEQSCKEAKKFEDPIAVCIFTTKQNTIGQLKKDIQNNKFVAKCLFSLFYYNKSHDNRTYIERDGIFWHTQTSKNGSALNSLLFNYNKRLQSIKVLHAQVLIKSLDGDIILNSRESGKQIEQGPDYQKNIPRSTQTNGLSFEYTGCDNKNYRILVGIYSMVTTKYNFQVQFSFQLIDRSIFVMNKKFYIQAVAYKKPDQKTIENTPDKLFSEQITSIQITKQTYSIKSINNQLLYEELKKTR